MERDSSLPQSAGWVANFRLFLSITAAGWCSSSCRIFPVYEHGGAPIPTSFQPFCADALITGASIAQRAKPDTVPQTPAACTALQASLGEKARGGEEGDSSRGFGVPVSRCSAAHAWRDKGRAVRRDRFPGSATQSMGRAGSLPSDALRPY